MRYAIYLLLFLYLPLNGICSKEDSATQKHTPEKLYRVNYWVTGSIIALGTVGDLIAIPRLKSKAPLSDEELLFVNSSQQKDLINNLDSWALNQSTSDRQMWKKISDDGEILLFILPALLVIDKNIRKDWLRILAMYVEGHTITFTFYNYSPLGPYFQNRLRPAVYYSELGVDAQKNSNNRNSFYSGHVASSAYSTFFIAKVYCDYHPDLGVAKYLLYLAASVPPLAIGYARIRSVDHFPSDVAVGFALGAIIGIVLPELHKNPKFKNVSLGMFESPEGMGLSFQWKINSHKPLILSQNN